MYASRRHFLRAASSFALFSPSGVSAEDTSPQLAFPKNPRDRLAVASYPFRAYIDAPANRDRDKSKPGFDLLGFARSVKADLGVHNIEPLNAHFASTDPDYVRRLRDDLKAIGVGVVNVAADVPGSLYDPDEEVRKRAIEARARWVDVAAVLGSPSVRLNNPPARGAKPDATLMAASLRIL